MKHYKFARKLFPILQAMKIPDANAAVTKSGTSFKNLPACQESKVKSKQEVIDEARREGKTVHFAMLMVLCPSQECRMRKKTISKIQRMCCTTWW